MKILKEPKMEGGNLQQAEHDEVEEEINSHWKNPFDLYKALAVPRSEKTNPDRIRSAFCKLSYRHYPHSDEACDKQFCQIALSFLVLCDAELRRIYDNAGYEGLRKSEEYSEVSIFTKCPYQVYEDFFSGVNPADREWLLLNGPNRVSDAEESDEESEEESDEDVAHIVSKPVELEENKKLPVDKLKEIVDKPIPVPEGSAAKYSYLLESSDNHPKTDDPWTHIKRQFSDSHNADKTETNSTKKTKI